MAHIVCNWQPDSRPGWWIMAFALPERLTQVIDLPYNFQLRRFD
jgi:hypothetical protein